MRIIPNQSEKRFESRLMKNGQKPIRINPEISIRMNPNQSGTKFSIQVNPNQYAHGMIQTEFSIRINSNYYDLGLIRIDQEWKLGFGLVRIHLNWCLRINRIKSDWFLTVFHQTRSKRFSDWFGMIHIGSDTYIGIFLIDSEWISIRYFRQGCFLWFDESMKTLKYLEREIFLKKRFMRKYLDFETY